MFKSKRWNLIKELTWADFKLKYSRSVLGFFWSLLRPLLMLGTLYLVFSVFFRLNIPYYQLFLLLGLVLWGFFVDSTILGMKSLVTKANLIKKTYFPRKVIVLSSNLTCLITLILNLVVFSLFLLIFKRTIGLALLIFPILLIELFILSLGLSYLLSALYVKYRDMDHMWEVLLQIGFWITPIVYPLSFVPEKILKFYMLNPLARIINDSRDAIIYNTLPSVQHLFITLIICLIFYIIGIIIFKKRTPKFTEEL